MVVALLKIDQVVSYEAVCETFTKISGLVVLTAGPLDFYVTAVTLVTLGCAVIIVNFKY